MTNSDDFQTFLIDADKGYNALGWFGTILAALMYLLIMPILTVFAIVGYYASDR